MTRDKKLTTLIRKTKFLKSPTVVDLVVKTGRVQVRHIIKNKPDWPLWMWAMHYLMAYDDPKYRQKKSLAHYFQKVVPLLRVAKKWGLPVSDELPPKALTSSCLLKQLQQF